MPASSVRGQKELAVALLEKRGTLRSSEFRSRGINPATLARLVERDVLRRPCRGLYELVDAEIEAAHSLVEVTKRVPRGVICLLSALEYHEITLQAPHQVWIALDTRSRAPSFRYPPVRAVRFGERSLAAGVETHIIDSVPVRIFNPAKSIVDCYRHRSVVGIDVAMEALRMGWRSGKVRPDDIVGYARALRIWSVIEPYLECVIADEG